MLNDEDKVCESCNWYSPSHAMTHGYCKRFPPVFTNLDDRGRPRFFNPVVSPTNHCGEYTPFDGEYEED